MQSSLVQAAAPFWEDRSSPLSSLDDVTLPGFAEYLRLFVTVVSKCKTEKARTGNWNATQASRVRAELEAALNQPESSLDLWAREWLCESTRTCIYCPFINYILWFPVKLFDARHKMVDSANVTFKTTAPCVCAAGCGCSVCILCVIKQENSFSPTARNRYLCCSELHLSQKSSTP